MSEGIFPWTWLNGRLLKYPSWRCQDGCRESWCLQCKSIFWQIYISDTFPPAGFRRGDRRARHLERGLVQRQHADHAATKGQPHCEYCNLTVFVFSLFIVIYNKVDGWTVKYQDSVTFIWHNGFDNEILRIITPRICIDVTPHVSIRPKPPCCSGCDSNTWTWLVQQETLDMEHYVSSAATETSCSSALLNICLLYLLSTGRVDGAEAGSTPSPEKILSHYRYYHYYCSNTITFSANSPLHM